MSTLKLVLIRHGTSLGNQAGRMMGQQDDKLAAAGIFESRRLAQHLFAMGDRPHCVYSSPLQRAMQTAHLLIEPFIESQESSENLESDHSDDERWQPTSMGNAGDPNKTLEHKLASPIESAEMLSVQPWLYLHDDLKELRGGIFEGLTWQQAQIQYPKLCLELEQSLAWIPIPGAESPQAAFQRARHFLDELFFNTRQNTRQNRRRYQQTLIPSAHSQETPPALDPVIWVISHGGLLLHLISALLGCDRTWGLTIPNTARFEFWLNCDGNPLSDHDRHNTTLWQIRRFNDTSHLH